VVLGRRFKTKLLTVMGWISVGIAILIFLIGLFFNVAGMFGVVSAQGFDDLENIEDWSDEEKEEFVAYFLVIFVVLWIVASVVFGAYSILFGIALLRLKDKVPYAHASGILNIVAGATYIIFIGFIVSFAAYVLEIMMFFAASEKFEK